MSPGDVLESLDAAKGSRLAGHQVEVFETPRLPLRQRHDWKVELTVCDASYIFSDAVFVFAALCLPELVSELVYPRC